jgi:hypothetical protein
VDLPAGAWALSGEERCTAAIVLGLALTVGLLQAGLTAL